MLLLPVRRTLPFSLLNFIRFTSAHPSPSLHQATHTWFISRFSQICLICKLAEGQPAPSSQSLIKMLSSAGPCTAAWGTPLGSDLPLVFMVLILTLGDCQFRQLSVHPHKPLLHQLVSSLITYIFWKLSPMPSRNILSCLCPSVLSLQQTESGTRRP